MKLELLSLSSWAATPTLWIIICFTQIKTCASQDEPTQKRKASASSLPVAAGLSSGFSSTNCNNCWATTLPAGERGSVPWTRQHEDPFQNVKHVPSSVTGLVSSVAHQDWNEPCKGGILSAVLWLWFWLLFIPESWLQQMFVIYQINIYLNMSLKMLEHRLLHEERALWSSKFEKH